MGIIVKNGKFENSSVNEFPTKMDVASHTRVDELVNLVGNVPLLRINFPTSADGRGFSIAKTLRQYGYKGHIRAYGHLLADQYPLALRCGFDDIEITGEHAIRQPESQWADAYLRTNVTYQEKLKDVADRAASPGPNGCLGYRRLEEVR